MKPKAPCGYYNRGWAYAKTGKKFEAIAEFAEFISLSEDPEIVEEARQEIESLHT